MDHDQKPNGVLSFRLYLQTVPLGNEKKESNLKLEHGNLFHALRIFMKSKREVFPMIKMTREEMNRSASTSINKMMGICVSFTVGMIEY